MTVLGSCCTNQMAQRKQLRVYVVNTVMPLAPVFMKVSRPYILMGPQDMRNKFGLGTGVPYSAKFSHVFIFVNSEALTKNISAKFFDTRCV